MSKYEKETIISFNEAERTANVYTFNAALRRKLETLAQERPTECSIEKRASDYIEGTVPKAWVKIRPPRACNMTDEQRRECGARLVAAQKSRV